MKKIIIFLIGIICLCSCVGSIGRTNERTYVVEKVKRLEGERQYSRYTVYGWSNGTFGPTFSFVDESNKFQPGDTLVIVKKK